MTANIFNTKSLADLAKRVPPNQIKQFEAFRKKTLEYHRKVNSLPDKLRPIDWDFYSRNVRKEFVKMVEEFQVKYEELNRSFAKRTEVLDHSKYYTEWQQLENEVKAEVEEYIEKSRERVRIYQEELRRLKNLRYENMTMEQFIELREEVESMIPGQGKPLFWPHTAEEQLVSKNIVETTVSSEKEINKDALTESGKAEDKNQILKDKEKDQNEAKKNDKEDENFEMPESKK